MAHNAVAPRNGGRSESIFQLPVAPPLSWCAWIHFGSRKNPNPEKCSKMPQNPRHPVHDVLGSAYFLRIISYLKAAIKSDALQAFMHLAVQAVEPVS
jgi:hypothetical protein